MPLIQRPLDGPIDLSALQRRDPRRFPLLLQSAAGGNALSRWDILFIADGTGLQLRHGETRTLDGVRAVNSPQAMSDLFVSLQKAVTYVCYGLVIVLAILLPILSLNQLVG